MPAAEVTSALAELLRARGVARVLSTIDGNGEEARLVGGAVRNALMGMPIVDIDLATTALPDEIMRRTKAAGLKAVPTGLEHGTVTVIFEGRSFEVTTLREDVETDGRHAVVRFGCSFAADAARRDFTMNALSLDREGRLHDDIGGLPDIKARRVRFIGDPRRRIREDFLRILRFFRFNAAYGKGALDDEGFAACVELREGLGRLSAERVRAELIKLIAAPNAAAVARAMLGGGFWPLLLGGAPHVGRLAYFLELTKGTADPLACLAALAVVTREDVERLRSKLRLSNVEARTLEDTASALERLHGWRHRIDASNFEPIFIEAVLTLGVSAIATALAIDASPAERDAAATLRRKAAQVPSFPLSGADILARGVPPGPEVGRILAQVRRNWAQARCPLDHDSLSAIVDDAMTTTPT